MFDSEWYDGRKEEMKHLNMRWVIAGATFSYRWYRFYFAIHAPNEVGMVRPEITGTAGLAGRAQHLMSKLPFGWRPGQEHARLFGWA